MNTNQEHWNKIYGSLNFDQMSWYQQDPARSIELLDKLSLPRDARIIDIGGGESYLPEALLALGYTNITVLDISDVAIEKAKKRLGNAAWTITWIVSDILEFHPPVQYDVWYGPNMCSDLPVKKYSQASLHANFQPDLKLIGCLREEHLTPSETVQPFIYCLFQKN
jgi:trans-aconitate methyltransferase